MTSGNIRPPHSMRRIEALAEVAHFRLCCELADQPDLQDAPVVIIDHSGVITDASPSPKRLGFQPARHISQFRRLIAQHPLKILPLNKKLYPAWPNQSTTPISASTRLIHS